ncbi:hypothetical protein DFH08DRAFT_781480 [Mycena albidolilacea]|uniref:Uncharacterized protein n=1 Tax=Mycena albidolilacea TaxID=1033008 RepID=A0AAD6ZYC3_9AGAR|nr:hypothetical protein DFH08DRAFT_781480 [Mycena albidolilacea]
MTHSSPASFLVLAIGTCVLFSFLIFHLWSFDRFKCLRCAPRPHLHVFRRLQLEGAQYSYLLSAPLIATYALVFAVIKYRQGFIEYEGGVIPKPYILWPDAERRAIFPLMLTFSLGWSLGIMSHLEELCFWLFFVNSGKKNWFSSLYFRVWIVGSGIALVYIPLLTISTRFYPLKCEAYAFLGGSVGSLLLTILFIPMLYKKEDVKTEIIVRLTKFHELNIIRTIFRFVCTVIWPVGAQTLMTGFPNWDVMRGCV